MRRNSEAIDLYLNRNAEYIGNKYAIKKGISYKLSSSDQEVLYETGQVFVLKNKQQMQTSYPCQAGSTIDCFIDGVDQLQVSIVEIFYDYDSESNAEKIVDLREKVLNYCSL